MVRRRSAALLEWLRQLLQRLRADLLLGLSVLPAQGQSRRDRRFDLGRSEQSRLVSGRGSVRQQEQFNGGEIGLSLAMHRGPVSLELTPKIALGVNHENVGINGSTLTTDANGNNTLSEGGLLALSSNIGQYSQNTFAIVPEFGATLGYQRHTPGPVDRGLFVPLLEPRGPGWRPDRLSGQPQLDPGGSGSAGGTLNHPALLSTSLVSGARVESWRHVSLVSLCERNAGQARRTIRPKKQMSSQALRIPTR